MPCQNYQNTRDRDEFTVKILHSSFYDPKLNGVAVGVIYVAVFLVCFGEKIMLNSVTLSQLNQSRELKKFYFWEKKDSPSAAAMKWSDVKHSCNPLRKHS